MEKAKSKNMKKPEAVISFAQRRHVLNKDSSFAVREAYNTLRTNIRFFLSNSGCKRFCITSGEMGEGKSITLLNLAISFAEDGQKVLLIDADLRRPAMARLLVENARPGLSNLLADMTTEAEAIRKEIRPNLDILFSGDVPPNPTGLLGSQRFENLMASLSKKYDYILVDTPPVNAVSDACIVANVLDGVLYLVRQNKTEKESVKRGINQLNLVGAKLLGFVLNGIEFDIEKKDYIEYK